MADTDSNNSEQIELEVYLEERKSLIEAKRESSNLFDKSILTLSAGTFGLSLTFINQIVPQINTETKHLLTIAWGLFCASMLSTLVSLITSQLACDRAIKIMEENNANESNIPGTATTLLNILSIASFIFGTIFLIYFCVSNLPIKEG